MNYTHVRCKHTLHTRYTCRRIDRLTAHTHKHSWTDRHTKHTYKHTLVTQRQTDTLHIYRTHIKFRGLNFCVFDWQENSWGINFRGHGGVVGTIVVECAI